MRGEREQMFIIMPFCGEIAATLVQMCAVAESEPGVLKS